MQHRHSEGKSDFIIQGLQLTKSFVCLFIDCFFNDLKHYSNSMQHRNSQLYNRIEADEKIDF